MNKDQGVNQDTIDSLILDIYEYAEKVKAIFTNMEDLVNKSTDFLDMDIDTELQKKFSNLKSNFQIVADNIISCAEDLTKVKQSYNAIDVELLNTISQSIQLDQ